MSRTADDDQSDPDQRWSQTRDELFRMIMEGRSFSGRERNCCFLNTGSSRFATISFVSGLDFPDDGRCIATTDWDSDGDLDFWTSNRSAPRLRLMINKSQTQNKFVALRLQGNGTTTNRDGIGARIEIKTSDSDLQKNIITLRAGEGFLSQSSKSLHFGLGDTTRIHAVVVNWPGGEKQIYRGIDANQRYLLVQDETQPKLISNRSMAARLQGSIQTPNPRNDRARIALTARVPMPSIRLSDQGSTRVENFDADQPTLLILWASWCEPCVSELQSLSKRMNEIREAGLRVLLLSVDRLGSTPTAADDVKERITASGYQGDWGFLRESEMQLLQELHDQFFFPKNPLPLPTSFLIDAHGRLSVLYRGPVAWDRVRGDMNLQNESYSESMHQAACFPGRALSHRRAIEVAERANLQTHYQVASWLEERNRYSDAVRSFKRLVEMKQDWALPHWHLAKLMLRQDNIQNAFQHAQRALNLDATNANIHNTVGLIYSRRQNQKQAEFHFRESIRYGIELPEPYNNLGTILAARRKLSEAGSYFRKAIELDDQFAEAYTNLGRVYADTNNIPRAIAQFQKAIEIDPKYIDALHNLGTMHAIQQNYPKAIEYYQAALKIAPHNVDVKRNLELAIKLLRTKK